jgi:hypothetical protein
MASSKASLRPITQCATFANGWTLPLLESLSSHDAVEHDVDLFNERVT